MEKVSEMVTDLLRSAAVDSPASLELTELTWAAIRGTRTLTLPVKIVTTVIWCVIFYALSAFVSFLPTTSEAVALAGGAFGLYIIVVSLVRIVWALLGPALLIIGVVCFFKRRATWNKISRQIASESVA